MVRKPSRDARSVQRLLALCGALLAVLMGSAGSAALGVCGPFTDVSDDAFCPFVLEIFYLGITSGTTPTTFEPTAPASRLQMAAFLSRSVDRVLSRGSRRAALNQYWTFDSNFTLALTTVGGAPVAVASDGEDLWVANQGSATVSRVHASDGKLLQTWTAADAAASALSAMGKVFVGGNSGGGLLYRIDPAQPAGSVTTVASGLPGYPNALAYDGTRIWAPSDSTLGAVSLITPGESLPWTVTTVTTGFSRLRGVLYDGANIWVTDAAAGTLLKLDSAGAILQTVTVGSWPQLPVFDGANIWVPNGGSASVSIVRASTGAVLSTLSGNGLIYPYAAAFDGQRVLVTNSPVTKLSVWKAANLTAIGSFDTVGDPSGACSDGINFWITIPIPGRLVRF
jgi:DNA-binding beta-propeller fold protein YncE